MGKSYSLSGLVLGTGAAEKIENPLVVLGVDAAAIVGDLEDRKAQLVRPRTEMSPGTPGLRYLIALSIRLEKICSSASRSLMMSGSGSIANLGVGFRGLMRHGGDDGLDQFAGIDPLRLEFAPPSRVRLRMAVIRRSILAIDDLMNPSASVKSSDSCLSSPSSAGSISPAATGARRLRCGQVLRSA